MFEKSVGNMFGRCEAQLSDATLNAAFFNARIPSLLLCGWNPFVCLQQRCSQVNSSRIASLLLRICSSKTLFAQQRWRSAVH